MAPRSITMTPSIPVLIVRNQRQQQQQQQQRILLLLMKLFVAVLPISTTATTTTIVTTTPFLFQQRRPPPRRQTCTGTRRSSDSLHERNSSDAFETDTTGTPRNRQSIDWSIIEEHVMASAQSKIDTTRVLQALSVDEPLAHLPYTPTGTTTGTTSITPTTFSTPIVRKNSNGSNNHVLKRQGRETAPTTPTTDLLYDHETDLRQRRPVSRYQISMAASVVCGTACYLLIHNTTIAILIAISVFVTAYLDADDHSLTAALVRILGRTTIRSVRASEPKLKAIARVVITGQEDIQDLQQTMRRLQQENEALQQQNRQLQQWKDTHIRINETLLPQYTLAQLKEMCRLHQRPVSGTKLELIERLLDANILQL